jgi:branched-chain amino acid transport system substrate-binding protein
MSANTNRRLSRRHVLRYGLLAGAGFVGGGALLQACGNSDSGAAGGELLRIGAVYPLTGSQADGANELRGVQLAAQLVNQDGGVRGRQVAIVVENAPSADVATAAVDRLIDRGISVIVGTYGSTQSLTASARASARGATYLETGAVADAITARGLPGVLRSVATGSTLGRNAARFAHDFVIPSLGLAVSDARVVVMFEGDQYGSSVAYGSLDEANRLGLKVVDTIKYDPAHTDFSQLAAAVAADQPDLILTAAYLEDAVAFRRAALASHLSVRSIIGTSSAYCRQDFGDLLGQDAVGLFASDKPDVTVNPAGLRPEGRQLLQRVSSAYFARHGQGMTAEAVAGFVGGWVLLHKILPSAASLRRADIWRAAMSLDIPAGTEINGAGVQFAPEGQADAGQNRRAASVIWEWLRARHIAVVDPPAYAQESPKILPVAS